MAWLGYLCRSSQAAIASYFGGHRARSQGKGLSQRLPGYLNAVLCGRNTKSGRRNYFIAPLQHTRHMPVAHMPLRSLRTNQ